VVGWLWLRGRCRACGSQISARYPLVEGLVSAFFVLLFLSEFTCGGAREPWSAGRAAFHAPWASDLGATQVWMRYWIQVLLAVTLLAAALIERDGRSVPPRLFWPTLTLSFAIPWIWRDARPLAFDALIGPTSGASPQFAQPLDLMLGAWVAMVAALCAWRFLVRDENGSRPAWLALVAIGLTLGWQLTSIVAAVWLTTLVCSNTNRRSLASLAIIASTVLLSWRPVLAIVVQFTQR
jgi:leader peptidase (prepilin peptidase)/N-methyltransferase